MIYSVQIIENTIISTADGETGCAAYFLEARFPTIRIAEEAGRVEIERRKSEGVRVSYNVFDPEGRPVGPYGPVE